MIIVGIVGIILGICTLLNFFTVSDPLSPQPVLYLQVICLCILTYYIVNRDLTGIVSIILKGTCVIGILFMVFIIITDYRAARIENEI